MIMPQSIREICPGLYKVIFLKKLAIYYTEIV